MIVDTSTEQLDVGRIERIGPMDVTVLVTDLGSVPMNIGAILHFDTVAGPSLATVRSLLSNGYRPSFGCGSDCGGFRSAAAGRCGSMIPTSTLTGI